MITQTKIKYTHRIKQQYIPLILANQRLILKLAKTDEPAKQLGTVINYWIRKNNPCLTREDRLKLISAALKLPADELKEMLPSVEEED